jgi:deoxyadenosine/deoxycytidine kinase
MENRFLTKEIITEKIPSHQKITIIILEKKPGHLKVRISTRGRMTEKARK